MLVHAVCYVAQQLKALCFVYVRMHACVYVCVYVVLCSTTLHIQVTMDKP